jgi:CBS domain-containing protein
MTKNPVTVSPDTTVEEAVTLAQEKKIGALLVVDNGRLVGIATTNDFFYKILNPILGIGDDYAFYDLAVIVNKLTPDFAIVHQRQKS